MIDVYIAQYNWPIPEGFSLDRTETLFPYWIVAQYFGELRLEVNGMKMLTPVGSVLFVPPNTPHRYSCPKDMRHHWVHIDSDLTAVLQRYQLEPNRLYLPPVYDEISDLFRVLSFTYHERNPFAKEYMSLKAEEIFARTAMQLSENIPEINPSLARRLRELRGEILEHPEEHWSIPEMAKRICMSESYFFPLYKTMFGDTPSHDLASIRIERACAMLRDGLSVTDTSEKCGYTNVYHFIRQFRQYIGVTPGQYHKTE